MPTRYQRRRSDEIKNRDKRNEPLVQPAEPVSDAPKKVVYEVRVPHDDYTAWPKEEKFRELWPSLFTRLGYKANEVEIYIERYKRIAVSR